MYLNERSVSYCKIGFCPTSCIFQRVDSDCGLISNVLLSFLVCNFEGYWKVSLPGKIYYWLSGNVFSIQAVTKWSSLRGMCQLSVSPFSMQILYRFERSEERARIIHSEFPSYLVQITHWGKKKARRGDLKQALKNGKTQLHFKANFFPFFCFLAVVWQIVLSAKLLYHKTWCDTSLHLHDSFHKTSL